MDTPGHQTGLEDILEEDDDINEESFRVTKMNQDIDYYQHKLKQLNSDRNIKWKLIQEYCDEETAVRCYEYFMEKFKECGDDLRDQDLEDINDYMISQDVPHVSDLQFELFRVWHLEGEIKMAQNELADLQGRVPFQIQNRPKEEGQ